MANLSPDTYGINKYVNEVQKNFTDINEDTLMLGIFGYTGQIFSDAIQNSIVMASEFANEGIPTKAKFEKNIISHALSMGITDINAVPSQMDILLTIMEDDLISQMKDNTFIFDKDSAIFFADKEFHLDYDIAIKRVLLPNGKFTYTAKYIVDVDNPISDISNPYLTPPAKINVQGVNAIFTGCTVRQVSRSSVFKKVLTNNTIDAKTINFSFDSQLAGFTIDVTEGPATTHMIPVYEGLTVEKSKYPYFYYCYLDTNVIRITFDRNSYAPRINSDVTINIQTTEGDGGNFTWAENNYPQFVFDSERYGYSNLACEVRPISGDSMYGTDKKSIDDLKKIIPKESISRNSITNVTDLQNFFNMISDANSKLYFNKKKDNALERAYYSYILMKNKLKTIIPTNTIDIAIKESELDTSGSLKKVFKRGSIIKYDGKEGVILPPNALLPANDPTKYAGDFLYTIPYNLIINTKPIYALYYLSTMNERKMLDFTYINEKCFYQYISTSIKWNRAYLTDPTTYSLSINLEQNINDKSMLIVDETGKITGTKIKCLMVIYDENDNPHRWTEASFVAYTDDPESGLNMMAFKFALTTTDEIDDNNKIRIENLYDIGTSTKSYAHLDPNTKAVIHIVSQQDAQYGLNGLDAIIPNLTGYSLSNSYTVLGGLDFFFNYSEVISSSVSVAKEPGLVYHIKGVPVIKHDYFSNEDRVEEFIGQLIARKTYIDHALTILEDNFGIDFKFFNTYGPSKRFTTDNISTFVNRVNLSLTFKLKLRVNYDPNIVDFITSDIKAVIENIDEINSLHISNIITDIERKYTESVIYFEFVDMNGYGPGVQHVYSMDLPNPVPEFLNINTLDTGTPDINIVLM